MQTPATDLRPKTPSAFESLALAGAVLALTGFALFELRPPRALPKDAARDVFSAGRAMEHVRWIAREPHPYGSDANARVVAYIADELRAHGFEVQIVEVTDPWSALPTKPLRNIVARRRGRASTGTVVVAAHHDSVPIGPGAGDDTAAVAAILETARALEHRSPLENDLVFLLTDGEEKGLLGARALAESAPPWFADVRAVLNFDARGTRGPALLFETSDDNAWLVRRFAAVSPVPLGSSLGYEVYRVMPNSTDFHVFRRLGFAGLNFALVEGASFYHTHLDRPENLDPRSVQHGGETMLYLAEDLGNADLAPALPREGKVVFFNATRSWLVVYSRSWAVAFAVVLALLLAVALVSSVRRGQTRVREISKALGLTLEAALLVALVAWALSRFILPVSFRAEESRLPRDDQTAWYLAGFVLLAFAVHGLVLGTGRRRIGIVPIHLAGLVWAALLALVATVWAPGASYLFLWPALAGCVLLFGAGGRSKSGAFGARRFLAALLAFSVTILIGAPVVYLTTVALGVERAWIAVAVASLLLGTLSSAIDILAGPRSGSLLWVGLVSGAACLITGVVIG